MRRGDIGDGNRVDERQAVEAWRTFAHGLVVEHRGNKRTWATHLAADGVVDEVTVVQPVVFPKFAETFLGFEVGRNLAPEIYGQEGVPDFTPADALTHPFVFETKGTSDRTFQAHHPQVLRYLEVGRPRIRRVIITNMATIAVYQLDGAGSLEVVPELSVNLRYLLEGSLDQAVGVADARRFVAFLDAFSFRSLDQAGKLQAIRSQQEWNPGLEVTSPEWLSRRIDAVVRRLTRDAGESMEAGALAAENAGRRASILSELQDLESRLGGDQDEVQQRSLTDYLESLPGSEAALAVSQYVAHTAYFATTRILIVRIWEDLGLLKPVLYDGGFDHWMDAFDDVLRQVVHFSFDGAANRYPSLYERGKANNYTWFNPSEDALTDVIYDLANTYFGEINSDVLGEVYESVLSRIDRKRIGQFYTPRDVIALIWDVVQFDVIAGEAESADRSLRVFDIATGSGGFLVEAARRLRDRTAHAIGAGASLDMTQALRDAAEGLVGVEIQRFSAYLAEVNLLVQLGYFIAQDPNASIPTLGVLCRDSMELHEPEHTRMDLDNQQPQTEGLLGPEGSKDDVFARVKSVGEHDFEFDVACGNPPYVGEKSAAASLARTRERLPYWEQFSGARLDLLYWFLILGVSKLRQGGHFGFITSEYWLRAEGAERTREYLASRCQIDRVILLRKLKPFPDAPGHDSLIITGRRTAPPDHALGGRDDQEQVTAHKPLVSIYTGPNLSKTDRQVVFDVIRKAGRGSGVRTFEAATSPNDLLGGSWHEMLQTREQALRRRKLRRHAEPLQIDVQEGVIATPVRLRPSDSDQLSQSSLRTLGGSASRHGIFVLSDDEVGTLGDLNAEERSRLRPIANTRDVLPYATALPDKPDRMVYLARSSRDTGGMSLEEVHRLPFLAGLPALEAHMRRFEPLLLQKVQSYRTPVRRPWWEVHNHRPDILRHDRDPSDHAWADYALVARWGGGGQLVAGLAPAGSVPASGMQAITSEMAPAAYIVGVLNSSVGQELAEQMPPGVMQQDLLEQLPLPYLSEVAEEIAGVTRELADTVLDLAKVHAPKWPLATGTLAADITLPDVPADAWLPSSGPRAHWGQLQSVGWISDVATSGPQSQGIDAAEIERDLFGTYVRLSGRTGEAHVRLEIDDDRLLEVLSRNFAGLAAVGGRLRDVPQLSVPVDETKYIALFDEQLELLTALAQRYRTLRQRVDELLGWS